MRGRVTLRTTIGTAASQSCLSTKPGLTRRSCVPTGAAARRGQLRAGRHLRFARGGSPAVWIETHACFQKETNARMSVRPWLAHPADDYARMLHARDGRGDAEPAQGAARQRPRDLPRARDHQAAAATGLAKEVGSTTYPLPSSRWWTGKDSRATRRRGGPARFRARRSVPPCGAAGRTSRSGGSYVSVRCRIQRPEFMSLA
jgi:hypothetical protein